jgi:hypothetical protein
MLCDILVAFDKKLFTSCNKTEAVALAAWSSGIASDCGVVGREITSRQGIGWQFKKNRRCQGLDLLNVRLFTSN